MSTAVLAQATVLAHTRPMEGGEELVLAHPEGARRARPGQFFQIGVDAKGTLLRRPYSIAAIDPGRGRLSFLFSVVGQGSAWLSGLSNGQAVDLIGPLGNGFVIDGGTSPVCVAGGLGVAVFPPLVDALVRAGRPPIVLQGARTGSRLLPDDRFAGASVQVATDDGSRGWRGSVVSLLRTVAAPSQEWFVCGPTPMLRAVIRLAGSVGVSLDRIQVALETPMGCGMGTCLGCVVPAAAGGYLLTCQEGPCLRADQVAWDRITDAFHE
ncbi:MAG TPA: dihydroorotate dehydrogenase electron transfer subunit [Candidatus Limnocylindrales bacterium]|nr:dihydroorotate dehydrogenase electron transfer subunit [Candidatus Limnocylindrales bacterium]